MPNFDGTGPKGAGPMTGRGMGYCVLPLGQVPVPLPGRMPVPCGRGRGLHPCSEFGVGRGQGMMKGRFWQGR